MTRCAGEPSLSEILADPLVRVIMRADGVDPQRLESVMRRTAMLLDRAPLQRIDTPRHACR